MRIYSKAILLSKKNINCRHLDWPKRTTEEFIVL